MEEEDIVKGAKVLLQRSDFRKRGFLGFNFYFGFGISEKN